MIFGFNELSWLGYLIFSYLVILVAYRMWGRTGLMVFVPVSIILGNIQVLKVMSIFGVETVMGNIAFGGIFLISDILTENEGPKYARKIVSIGFVTMMFFALSMNWAISINPGLQDTFQEHLAPVFAMNFTEASLVRVTVASFVAFAVSQLCDIWSYAMIKKISPKFRDIWIRNNASTLLGQVVDNVIFAILAFGGVFPVKDLISIAFSMYLLEAFIALCDTPFVYIATYWKNNGKIKDID